MAITSSLFTAETKLDKYNISVPGTVNTDDVDVDKDKAPASYNAIMQDYANIKKHFNTLSSQLTKSKSKVKGSKLKSSISKASRNVSNQATYCSNRANDLRVLFILITSFLIFLLTPLFSAIFFSFHKLYLLISSTICRIYCSIYFFF